MQVKAEFILEIDSNSPMQIMEEFILNIFSNGESISGYAFVYTRDGDENNWKELK